MSTVDHVPAGPPPHTPDAGLERVKRVFGGRVPEVTDEDRAKVDALITQAREMIGGRRRYAA